MNQTHNKKELVWIEYIDSSLFFKQIVKEHTENTEAVIQLPVLQ